MSDASTRYGPELIPYEHGYRLNFRYRGQRYRRKFRTREQALTFLARLYSNEPAAPDPDLHEEIRAYLRWSEVDKKKGASWVVSLSHILGLFEQHLQSCSVSSLQNVRTDHMRSFRAAWLVSNKHRSENTWEKYRQGISSLLNWWNKRDPLVINVAADEEFKRRVQQNPPQTLEKDEIQLILSYFDSQDYGRQYPLGTAIRILLYTGIRLGELVSLKWSDVKLTGHPVIRCGTKTKKTRTVPIADVLLPYLRSLPRSEEYVFDDGHGSPLYHRKRYYQALQQACAVIGIPRRSIHSLRHTFVRYLLEAGVPINEVSKIVGHEDIRTTMRYAQHFSIGRARDAVNQLNFL